MSVPPDVAARVRVSVPSLCRDRGGWPVATAAERHASIRVPGADPASFAWIDIPRATVGGLHAVRGRSLWRPIARPGTDLRGGDWLGTGEALALLDATSPGTAPDPAPLHRSPPFDPAPPLGAPPGRTGTFERRGRAVVETFADAALAGLAGFARDRMLHDGRWLYLRVPCPALSAYVGVGVEGPSIPRAARFPVGAPERLDAYVRFVEGMGHEWGAAVRVALRDLDIGRPLIDPDDAELHAFANAACGQVLDEVRWVRASLRGGGGDEAAGALRAAAAGVARWAALGLAGLVRAPIDMADAIRAAAHAARSLAEVAMPRRPTRHLRAIALYAEVYALPALAPMELAEADRDALEGMAPP